MITKQKIIYLLSVFLFISIGWGCIDSVEVELWGECYNIEETTSLNLSQSGLTGVIPPEIGDLENLTYLNLYSNQLIGEIPSEIGNLANLSYLDLEINQLTGQIPSEISNLVNLIFLHLNENNLTGEIPENICDLTIDWSGIWSPEYYQIPYFSIDDNNLCPPYPECIVENIEYQNISECVSYPGDECILENGDIGFFDCELCCWDLFLLSWLGDGYCDQYGGCAWEGPQYNCEELGYDCGDCNENWNNEDIPELCSQNYFPGYECETYGGSLGVFDCDLNCLDYYQDLYVYLNDSYCDDGTYIINLNCEEFGYECGVCNDEWSSYDIFGFCYDDCSLIGNVNNDQLINIYDVIVLIQCLIENNFLYCNNNCSDANEDENVNILDVVTIVNLILDIE